MRVTIIADATLPVPPHTYGGTERVVAELCEGLTARGHHVTLMADPTSGAPCSRLLGHRPASARWTSRAYRKALFQLLSVIASRESDVVHVFGRVDYTEALIRGRKPLLYTFENPVADWEVRWLRRRLRERVGLASISDAQRVDIPGARWVTVYNSVDTERIAPPADLRSDYLAFLGRITWNKGADVAIRVARAAGLPLKIAGNISREPGGVEYFETEVRPQLGPDVEWIGEISDEQKSDFLGQARALLFPIRWDEPFGLVVAEALAAGTPVIAFRRGSAPELVKDGMTGFVCGSEAEMIDRVGRTVELDRAECRTAAVRRFSRSTMTDGYERAYRMVGAVSQDGVPEAVEREPHG